jgi:hypothetical protein
VLGRLRWSPLSRADCVSVWAAKPTGHCAQVHTGGQKRAGASMPRTLDMLRTGIVCGTATCVGRLPRRFRRSDYRPCRQSFPLRAVRTCR